MPSVSPRTRAGSRPLLARTPGPPIARTPGPLIARAGPRLLVAGRRGGQVGQATVEVVALLPVLAVVLAAAWQAVLAGHAVWAATTAARAAARAHAVGDDPAQVARARLPGSLEPGLRVTADGGDVEVDVRIPSLPGLPSPGRVHAEAGFEPQS
jgi:hypothetical protein